MTTLENAVEIDQQQNVSHKHDHDHVHEETNEYVNDETKSNAGETIETNQQNNSSHLLDVAGRDECFPEGFRPETRIVDSKIYNQIKSKTPEIMKTYQPNEDSPYVLNIAGYQYLSENISKSLMPETLIVDSKVYDQNKSKTIGSMETYQPNENSPCFLNIAGHQCSLENKCESLMPKNLIADSKVYDQTKSKATGIMQTYQPSEDSPYLLNIVGFRYSSDNESKTLIPETLDSRTTASAKTDRPRDAEAVPEDSSPTERLKRHRLEMAGRVWIPDIWGQEELLKDWVDCTSFDASLMNNTIMSARAALIEEGREQIPTG